MTVTTEILQPPKPEVVLRDVVSALHEDLGSGDVTADLIPARQRAHATLVCREAARLAGQAWFTGCFRYLDPDCHLQWTVQDGDTLSPGAVVCVMAGNTRAMLGAERCAINFLQTLSGTATLAAHYVQAAAGFRAQILDTRKTLPSLRYAQKYAVRCGGGHNHRHGLYDRVLIKENHIAALGSIAAAIKQARALHPSVQVEVEVENQQQLEQAITAQPDRIMLDNFDLQGLAAAVRMTANRIPLEASGGIELDAVAAIAASGVDFISVGAITKHLQAVDFSLRFA